MMKGQKGFVLTGTCVNASATKGFWTAVSARVQRWIELHRQRQLLAQMSDDALKDLGLSRADTLDETRRPFWDDPLRH